MRTKFRWDNSIHGWDKTTYYKFWQVDAKWRPDNYTEVKIETRTYNSNMAAFRFPKPGVVYLSRALRYLIKMWYANSYLPS